MGMSASAGIAFGVNFGEEYELPWDALGDPELWWREVNEYENPLPEPDWEAPRELDRPAEAVSAYFDHQHKWQEEHPFPVDVIYHCSSDYPMTILAVKGTHITAYAGGPVKFDPRMEVDAGSLLAFMAFCSDYKIDLPEGLQWLLFSNWG